jgi:hypothetical protein
MVKVLLELEEKTHKKLSETARKKHYSLRGYICRELDKIVSKEDLKADCKQSEGDDDLFMTAEDIMKLPN